MPRIKRWFKMSHDINRDPEMWEFRERIGARADPIWEEILSIADRNEGDLPGALESYQRLLAGACHSTQRQVRAALEWLTTPPHTWLTVGSEGSARVTNYFKYNETKEDKKIPGGKRSDPLLPSETSFPSKNPKKDSKDSPPDPKAIEATQLLSDLIFANFPARTLPSDAVLKNWTKEAELLHKKDGHTWDEIFNLLRWCQNDPFWKCNILSMGKFREKWNQLLAQSSRASVQSPGESQKERLQRAANRGLPKHD